MCAFTSICYCATRMREGVLLPFFYVFFLLLWYLIRLANEVFRLTCISGRKDKLCYCMGFWWGKRFSVLYGTVHEQFKYLLTMLDCFAIGAAVCCWHDDTISPFWQGHQVGLIFF